jgi:hypothetical protein
MSQEEIEILKEIKNKDWFYRLIMIR